MVEVERLRDAVERRPPAIAGLLAALAFATGRFVWGTNAGSAVAACIDVAVGFVVWTSVFALARRRDCDVMGFGSDRARAEVVRALRTGVLPADTARDLWIRRLLARRRQQRAWRGAPAWVVMALLPVGALTAGVIKGDAETAAVGAIGILLVALARVHQRRILHRYDRMEAELDARAAHPGVPS